MSDILDEALNDAKDEKKIILFKESLPKIIIATIIIVISIITYNWYSNKVENYNKTMGDMLIDIMNNTSKDSDTDIKAFIEASDNRQIELVEIIKIQQLMQAEDKHLVLKSLEEIINNENYLEITKSYARILWLNQILDVKDITDEQKMKARNHMQYFNDEKQIFYTTATILKAVFYQIYNQNDLAKEYANSILNMKNASLVAKEQAKAVLANISYTTNK